MVAVVEGNVDAQLGGGVEQAILLRVLLDGVDVRAVGNPVNDVGPGAAAVVGAIDVGAPVGEAVAIDGGVGGFGVEVAGLNAGDLAPRRHRWRGHIVPMRAVVAGDVDEAVVGAGPDGLRVQRRWAERIDHAEAIGHLLVDVLGRDGIEIRGHGRVDAREVGADLFPGLAAVAGAEDELVGVVERVIGLGEDLGQRPRAAIGIGRIGGRDVAAFGRGHVERIVAAPIAVAVEQVGVLGIGHHG